MEFAVLGWPGDEVTLDLDHEVFAYAGKFVLPGTGKAVAREDGDRVAAAAFDADRTDGSVCRIRYVTVREDRRGRAIGPRLLAVVADRALDRAFETVVIAVNNPFAYQAASRAGFAFTGETTGLAELVMARPGDRDPAGYRAGLELFAERELPPAAADFVRTHAGDAPPPLVDLDGA